MQKASATHRWHMAVLIPARNEEALLRRCLHSVQQARQAVQEVVTTDVIVVSDSSTDRTEMIAEECLRHSGMVVRTQAGRVGAARALAARHALARYRGPIECCWLANTDADCVVPVDWLALQVLAARKGVPALAGVVDVDSYDDHKPVVQTQFRLTYRIHDDGPHPHVHGANLGVRADSYLHAGGWAALDTAEDHDLWRRLQNTAEPCVADARLKVITSGRRVGRAPHGFAEALAAHNEVEA